MRITSKGQVTIPQAIRERFGLLPHTAVQFREENGKVVLEPLADQPSHGEVGLHRLRQARLRTRLNTDVLPALTGAAYGTAVYFSYLQTPIICYSVNFENHRFFLSD